MAHGDSKRRRFKNPFSYAIMGQLIKSRSALESVKRMERFKLNILTQDQPIQGNQKDELIMEKILIPFCDPKLKSIDVKDFKIELHSDHLLIFHKFKVSYESDDTGLPKEVESFGEKMVLKKFIGGVDIFVGRESHLPVLKLTFTGLDDYDFFVDDYAIAKDGYNKIKNWLLNP